MTIWTINWVNYNYFATQFCKKMFFIYLMNTVYVCENYVNISYSHFERATLDFVNIDSAYFYSTNNMCHKLQISVNTQHWPPYLVLQVLYRSWIRLVRSWKTEALVSPMLLSPHPCAARHVPPCWRASTSTTTTPTPTMRTAPPLPGKFSTSHAHSLSTSTTPATGQVGYMHSHIQHHVYIQ